MELDEDKAPLPPFRVQVDIKGENWQYVVRVLEDLAVVLRDHVPERPMGSGGEGGHHSVTVSKREVSPEIYRNELSEWLRRTLPACRR
ncbi:MAG: hypothetical protein WB974_07960 [Acidobacteriaceae bacterium]